MALRLYLTNSVAPYTPATKRGAWDASGATLACYLGSGPAGTATTAAQAETSTTNLWDVLIGRWISDGAIAAGTLSGTVQWIIGAKESSASANDFWHIHIYVTSGDSDTPRGTLLADSIGATEWPTTAAGAGEGAKTVSTVSVQVGDRIVVEVGYQAANTSATSFTGTINYGNAGTQDLTSGSTAVTTLPGWFEFSGAGAGMFYPTPSSLSDDFNDNTVDTTKWPSNYGTYVEVGGRARISTLSTDYSAYATNPAYNFAESSISAQIWGTTAGGATVECYASLLVYTVGGTDAGFFVDAVAGLQIVLRDNFDDAAFLQITYDPVAHAWVRLRETGGNLYWETSPDGLSWTQQRTAASPAWVGRGQLTVLMESHRDAGTDSFVEYDNFNIVPARNPVVAVSRAAAQRASSW